MVYELSPTTARPRISDAHEPSRVSRWLDRFAADQQSPFGSDVPAYLAFGVAGIAAGAATLTGLLAAREMSLTLVVTLAVAALAAFVLAGLARQALLGTEQHALLEDVVLALGAVAGVAALLGEPVLVTLDAMVLAIGVFLIPGRFGCLASGCCYGRPNGFGIRYEGGLHDDDPLTGVRLFPLPLVDAAWLAIIAAVGGLLLFSDAPAGTAVSFWLIAYGIGRFAMDFVRGDRHARRFGPLTFAQLFSVVVVLGVIAADEIRRGADPQRSAAAAAAVLLVAAAYLARRRWIVVDRGPIDEDTVAEWEVMLPQLEHAARDMHGGATVLAQTGRGGVRVSLVVDPLDGGCEMHAYAFDGEGWTLTHEDGVTFAAVALQQLPAHSVVRADTCEHQTFHLWAIVDPATSPGSTVHDEPGAILLRARAAAAETRDVPLRAAREAPLDPALLPRR
jgi:prolipoprotein diacylglyceryl transferase